MNALNSPADILKDKHGSEYLNFSTWCMKTYYLNRKRQNYKTNGILWKTQIMSAKYCNFLVV